MLQVNPQALLEQVAVALLGTVHAVHEEPHVLTLVSSAQVALAPVPHWWYPVMHVNPHAGVEPEHVAVAFVGAVHGVHDVPQDWFERFDTQVVPEPPEHAW